jgi:hypothetical protein
MPVIAARSRPGYRVLSESDRSKEYYVHFSKLTKRWECNCPNWLYRASKTGQNCKHVREVLSLLQTFAGTKQSQLF